MKPLRVLTLKSAVRMKGYQVVPSCDTVRFLPFLGENFVNCKICLESDLLTSRDNNSAK